MAGEIGSINVKIGVDTGDLKKGIEIAKAKVGELRTGLNQGAKDFAKYGAAAALAGAAIAAHIVKNSLDAIDAQAKMAQQLNTTSASMATLKRAGELAGVSIEQIATSSRSLDVRLGEAAGGTGEAVKSLKRLHLTAQELSAVPLDERIRKINDAIAENIPAAERAAVAADLFGSRNASAISQLNSGVLKEATEQVKLFGTAISDVDAAKIEMANDSMSAISTATEGIITQFTVALAPILKVITDEFTNATKEAGGFGNVSVGVFDDMVTSIGFVLDAIDGIERTFTITGNALVLGISEIAAAYGKHIRNILEIANEVPLVNLEEPLSKVREFVALQEGVIKLSKEEVDRILNAPPPSDGLQRFVKDAQEMGEAAAAAAVAARVIPDTEENTTSPLAAFVVTEEEFQAAMTLHADRLALLHEQNIIAGDNGLTLQQYLNQLELDEGEKHSKDMFNQTQSAEKRISAAKQASAKVRQSLALSESRGAIGALAGFNKDAFKLNKAFGISDALISTYQGIASALKMPFPLNIAAAAKTAAVGFAQVSNIRAQSFGGGGGGGGGISAGGVGGGAQPATQGQAITGGENSSQNINISGISATDLISGSQLVSVLNAAIADGSTITGIN